MAPFAERTEADAVEPAAPQSLATSEPLEQDSLPAPDEVALIAPIAPEPKQTVVVQDDHSAVVLRPRWIACPCSVAASRDMLVIKYTPP